MTDYYSPPNPSVHISLPDQSVGLLCEDDVFRNQARLFYTESPPAAGIRTEMLRLGPGETYTLRWSVYPVAGPDYFDFVNLVRQDWGSNFTVDGAWTFFDPDPILDQPIDKLRAQFNRLGIRYAISNGGWVDRKHDPKRIGFGTGVLDDYWADFRRRLREAAGRIREAAPQVKILIYYDTPARHVRGRPRAIPRQLADGCPRQPAIDRLGRPYSLTYSVVATLKNSYGRAMLAAVDRYLSETNSDGLYWDEMEGVAFGIPLITYNQFDGHSCMLDPKRYTIQREIGITAAGRNPSIGRDRPRSQPRRTSDGQRFSLHPRPAGHRSATHGRDPAQRLLVLRRQFRHAAGLHRRQQGFRQHNAGTAHGLPAGRHEARYRARRYLATCSPSRPSNCTRLHAGQGTHHCAPRRQLWLARKAVPRPVAPFRP